MRGLLNILRSRLIYKINIPIAILLFVCIVSWAYFHIEHEETFAKANITTEVDRVANTVKLGLHYAMESNSRDDIKEIVSDYSRLREIREIRILNKQGEVMFSNNPEDTSTKIALDTPLCQVCHNSTPPLLAPPLPQRLYSDDHSGEDHILRLTTPIENEQTCSSLSSCHFHKPEERILGVLDIAFSMYEGEAFIAKFKTNTSKLAVLLFVTTFLTLFFLVFVLIEHPIARIIGSARALARGEHPPQCLWQLDEIGQLARAIHKMGSDLIAYNDQLIFQKDLYQDLFEGVPCLVTVHSRDFRLLRFNRSFAEKFSANVGDYCYKAYKNRDTRCDDCPVEKTFETGLSVSTEETGYYKDGTKANWIVTTSPIYDSEGNLVAAMEMCLDITTRKELEEELKLSEEKYCDIFNNIPSAVFVLDQTDFTILDCNKFATVMYGATKGELIGQSYIDLFPEGRDSGVIEAIHSGEGINQTRQIARDGREFFVSISSSPSGFAGKSVYLVTAGDITSRLETEQQLIQASKMATLGEMATGVAHEINQPLSVIQTSIDLVKRSLSRNTMPDEAVLKRVTELVGGQVERATKIISHMREFGRKSEIELVEVALNDVLKRAFEFFSQQLTLHDIEVVWELDERLPTVLCEPNRMEQVFINFLINARDAIEEKAAKSEGPITRQIAIKTMYNQDTVTVRISDSGVGIPPEIADKIFEPFFTTKQVGKGTGLGLSISYGIIKDYGGVIHVINNPTGGASFFIRLPVANKPDEWRLA